MTDQTPPPPQPPADAVQPGYPPPGYLPPGYPPPGYAYVAAPPTNTLAIVTIIAAFLLPVAGIVTGHIALAQISRSGEGGRGMAQAGLIISYVFTALYVIAIIAMILGLAAFGAFFGGVVSEIPMEEFERFETP